MLSQNVAQESSAKVKQQLESVGPDGSGITSGVAKL